MGTLEEADREAATVAKAPRVTLEEIKASIAQLFYLSGFEAYAGASAVNRFVFIPGAVDLTIPLSVLTICIAVTKTGYTIIGKSAPASAENFNAELWRKLAYEDVIRQLWPLMGFALRDRLHRS